MKPNLNYILTVTESEIKSKVEPIFLKKDTVKKALQELKQEIKDTQEDLNFKNFFDTMSKFHRYSFNNNLLIQVQFPGATFVAGYRKWQDKFNRQVRKGEKGIRIVAPRVKKITNEETGELEKTILYFVVVVVFDISQTDQIPGKPEVEIKTWGEFMKPTPQDTTNYYRIFQEYLDSQNIPLVLKEFYGTTKGYSNGKEVVIDKDLEGTDQFFVAIHEFSHHKLHWITKGGKKLVNKSYSREKMELEAEAVVYVVTKELGFKSTALKYLAHWQRKEDIVNSLQNVHAISREVLEVLTEKEVITDSMGT